MPRQRDVVMGSVASIKLHDAAVRKAVELHRPYEVVTGELVQEDPDVYAVVYTAPKGGTRHVVATRNQRANACKLRDLLSIAWAEGHWASGRE